MESTPQQTQATEHYPSVNLSPEAVINDYRLAYRSRQASLTGRKEVLTGKAKFGIFGDGKELPQLALARSFRPGDFRSGYYRDQTWAMATGVQNLREFFAQLYADPNLEREPNSGGRQMNAHFASHSLNTDGSWRDLTAQPNTHADGSPTASQMPRLAGLAQASKLYRELDELKAIQENFSQNGNEVAFGTIGNASTAEGHFWETLNAVGVIGAPLVMSIWDDGYGISVPNEFQVTRDLTDLLSGFQREGDGRGFEIFRVKGWDYLALMRTYAEATQLARESHVPSIIHVVELTQPQGHSTSGSHERYKSEDRLAWEKEYDCVARMRSWIIEENIATAEELDAWEKEDRKQIRDEKNAAYAAYLAPIKQERDQLVKLLNQLASQLDAARTIAERLQRLDNPSRGELQIAAHDALRAARGAGVDNDALVNWKADHARTSAALYSEHLYSEHGDAALAVAVVAPEFDEDAPEIPGFELLNKCFDALLARDPRVIAFGEDVGQLGDVNQGFAGLQDKYGPLRVADTGIREATIAGQAIGLAARGLRPIAEVQYLDYFIYALQTLSDDLATLRWRTRGRQKAPAIIRTRGHRLEGIWHAGSPLGMMIHALRGVHICVPRDMTQAAGMYNTLFQAEEPAVVVEVLNGYRLREKMPRNIGEFTVPLGVPEVIREGDALTIATYGACCRIALEAADQLAELDIEVEVVDVQTLLPFDRQGVILDSLKKTSRIIFLDEDVPGGASAYMLQQVLERDQGYYWLDSLPVTISAKAHRPAFGSDGDYFSKPQVEDVFDAVVELLEEAGEV